jgi:hypothetical protein
MAQWGRLHQKDNLMHNTILRPLTDIAPPCHPQAEVSPTSLWLYFSILAVSVAILFTRMLVVVTTLKH